MYRHQRNSEGVGVELIHLRGQHYVLEVFVQRGNRALFNAMLLEFFYGVDEFLQVPLAVDGFGRVLQSLFLYHLPIAGFLHDVRQHRRRRSREQVGLNAFQQVKEVLDAVAGRGSYGRDLVGAQESVVKRHALLAPVVRDVVQRGLAHAARGQVYHPQQADGVGRIHEELQIGQHVLYFLAVVEAHGAYQAVRDARPAAGFFKRAALGVGAVENGYVVIGKPAVRRKVLYAFRYVARFVHLVREIQHLRRLAVLGLGPEVLGAAVLIVLYDLVGGVQDARGGAVILLQHHGGGVREVLLEIHDIAYVGAAPAVHALVGVAHHAEVVVLGRHRLDQHVLRVVGVLVLVHQDILEILLEILADLVLFLYQLDGAHDKVAEIHGAGFVELLLVAQVDLGRLHAGFVADRLGVYHVTLRVQQVVLGARDDGEVHRSFVLFGLEAEFRHGQTYQLLLVVVVVDHEVVFDPDEPAVLAQYARAQRVEGVYPHAAGIRHQLGHALLHFLRGLVGKSDGEYARGRHARGYEQRDL